jgi:hypothetical protein
MVWPRGIEVKPAPTGVGRNFEYLGSIKPTLNLRFLRPQMPRVTGREQRGEHSGDRAFIHDDLWKKSDCGASGNRPPYLVVTMPDLWEKFGHHFDKHLAGPYLVHAIDGDLLERELESLPQFNRVIGPALLSLLTVRLRAACGSSNRFDLSRCLRQAILVVTPAAFPKSQAFSRTRYQTTVKRNGALSLARC